MDRIQAQASKLWNIIFDDATASTYQNALNLTGTILKESAQLIWLAICSVFVFGAWVGDASIKTGTGIRTWVDKQSNPETQSSPQQSIADTGKDLLEKGRTSATYLISQAREQLGIEAEAPAAKPAAKSAAKSAAKPAAKPAEAPAAAPAAAPKASVPAPAAEPKATAVPATAPKAADATAATTVAEPQVTTVKATEDDEWPPKVDD